MISFKAKGIVIKEKNVGEADKSITVAFKDYGKISLYVKGCRKPKSPFIAGTQLFSYSEFVIYKKNDLLIVSQINIIKSFYSMFNDYTKLCFGHYFLEATNKFMMENMVNNDSVHLLLETQKALSLDKVQSRIIYSVFNFKILQISGFSPIVDFCYNCNSNNNSKIYFTFEGLVCDKCKLNTIFLKQISHTTLFTIKHILNSNINDLYNFTLSEKYIPELEDISKSYLKWHTDFEFKSLEFLV